MPKISYWESEQDCKESAEELANQIPLGSSLALIGGLGAGKTTFVRYLVRALKIDTPVSSPTFVLQHEYLSENVLVDHWDLYRLTGLPDELWENPGNNVYRLVEWADKFPEFLDTCDFILKIDLIKKGLKLIREVHFLQK